ncbi:hypothetical protein [Congregibacter sp.]|uniref:hypothetical protein n=1 Tax=Congregibacter sp. TaxID=2744308 RepID=UPI003F6C8361
MWVSAFYSFLIGENGMASSGKQHAFMLRAVKRNCNTLFFIINDFKTKFQGFRLYFTGFIRYFGCWAAVCCAVSRSLSKLEELSAHFARDPIIVRHTKPSDALPETLDIGFF